MNTERFIASRLIKGKSHLSGYARPVLLVSVTSTALGLAIMLISVFISYGFQNQIRTKVIGFGSHIQVLPYLKSAEIGSDEMPIDQEFYRDYKSFNQIASMQPVAYKPGILQRTRKNTQGNREIQGILFKGIDHNFDIDFLKKNLKEGTLIHFGRDPSRDVLISRKIASNLSVKVGDTLAAILISKKIGYSVAPDYRRFRVCGIYETGLEEFDNEYVFVDIYHIQRANGWGINAIPDINDTLKTDGIEIKLNTLTTAGKIDWTINGRPYPTDVLHLKPVNAEYTCIGRDVNKKLVADTVILEVHNTNRVYVASEKGYEPDAYRKEIKNETDTVDVVVSDLRGSCNYYCGGFEINLKNWSDLKSTDKWLYKLIGPKYSTKTIIEQQPQIFNWLDLVDLNVNIIIALMLVVAIINLVSAILVLILERSKMIGLLKSMGAQNKTVRNIFFYFTLNILVRGMIIGNIIVLVIYVIQNTTGVIELNPETYFVSTVPIEFDWVGYVFVNVLTAAVCMLAFFLPVVLVSRINPVKAIKIE